MSQLKRFATSHPILFSVFITFVALVFYVCAGIFSEVVTQDRAGQDVAEALGRLFGSGLFVYLLWRFGWCESADLTKAGTISAWLIVLPIAVIGLCLLTTTFVFAIPEEIHEAAKNGDLERVEELLDLNPASVNSPDIDKFTPLHHAIDGGHLKVAALLIDRGADVEAVNFMFETPLHIAADEGNAEATRLLLQHGADPGKREMRDRIPLYLACNWGRDLETVRLLIDAGSDVNDKNARGEMVLISTLYYGKKEIIDLLLDRGAKIPDDEETLQRVLYITASNGMERPFNIAVEKSEKQDMAWWSEVPMQACARGGSVAIARMLTEKGVALFDKNRYGIEPLHIAAEHGRLEFVDFLLSNGADIDSPSRMGKTALHFARENEHEELAVVLIDRGASQSPPEFPILRGNYLGQESPGKIPKRFAPGIVSSHSFNSEHSPCIFSPDLKEVYWTDQFRGPILHMKREGDVWTAPEPAPFCSEYGDGEPIFSPDGEKMFFLSFRPIQPDGPHDKENMWVVERTPEGWSEAKPVSPKINAFDLHWLFSVTSNGTIYFASPSGNSYGQNDIYRSRMVDGEYGEPENLGSVINTSGVDHTPYIAPDESYLIYVSPQGSDTRRWSYQISYRNPDGSWGKPRDLGDEVNSVEHALCPAITPDGRFMFFIGNGDIYWVDAEFIRRIPEELR